MEGLARLIGILLAIAFQFYCAWFITINFLRLIKKYLQKRGIEIKGSRRKHPKTAKKNSNTNKEYDTGWKWNETTQRWDPPDHIKAKPESEQTTNPQKEQSEPEVKTATIDFSNAYQAKYLFSTNEWYNYKKLKEIAEVKGYVVCPKVRLLDIIEPKRGEQHYKTLFYKIQAKHVDFVICDSNMRIKTIIELDDNTHKREDRIERDKFVDLILKSVGYKVIHVKEITNDILDLV